MHLNGNEIETTQIGLNTLFLSSD